MFQAPKVINVLVRGFSGLHQSKFKYNNNGAFYYAKTRIVVAFFCFFLFLYAGAMCRRLL